MTIAMNRLTIPPSPNWYENSIMTCAPDRTLIYGARSNIIIMKNPSYRTSYPAFVDIIPKAHTQRITSVDINAEWGEPNKYLVTAAEDKQVKCWDVPSKTLKLHHSGHLNHGKLIGAVFINEEKVISVSEDGTVIVWNIVLHETVLLSELFSFKCVVTCLKACPHVWWMVAFGLNNGLVVVADVRKKGQLLYKLRGHEKSVVSLAWCPAPINIFPQDPKNYIGGSKATTRLTLPEAVDDPCLVGKGGDVGIQPDLIEADPQFNTSSQSKYIDCSSSSSENRQVAEDESLVQAVANVDIEQQNKKPDANLIEKVEILGVPESEPPRKEYLLASSAKESNIYIWRAGTDGKLQTSLILPSKKVVRKSKLIEKIWITLSWPVPTKLLSSSRYNELLQWTLPKPADESRPATVVHHDHCALLFCIAAPLHIFDEVNWSISTKRGNYAWTASQDKWLLNTSTADRRNLSCYPTFGASIECMDVGCGDPYKIAIGTSDGFIKVWDSSIPHLRQVHMSIFYQKIQSKVVALAWHPEQETVLAFGTQEGRIGYFDTTNKHKLPVIYPHCFNTEIHRLQYAPFLKTGIFTLYAMAEGKLILFEPTSNEIIEIETPRSDYPYMFSWKPDFSCFLLNTRTGSLVTYNEDLIISDVSYINHKIPQMLWHPHAVHRTESKEFSNLIACILDSKQVVVLNMAIQTRIAEEKIVARYDGQGDIITNIRWSNFDESILAIASENGIIQVWDIVISTIISTIVNPLHESVQAIQYSNIDSNLIIAGGKDNMLRVWDTTKFPPYDEQQLAIERNLASKRKIKEYEKVNRDNIHPPDKDEKGKGKTKSKVTLFPKFYAAKNTSDMLQDLKRLLAWKITEEKIEKDPHDTRDVDILEIFGSHEDMIKIITLNENSQLLKGNYSLSTILTLVKGDVSEVIKEAIDQKRVTQLTIALAPMASPRLWQMACETYADQLSETNGAEPLEIATYYLACHEIKKAINVLCDGSLFREALALAKCRFEDTNEVLLEVIEKWARYAHRTGNFELAAQCYIFLGKLGEAAISLYKRTDPDVMLFAAELADKAGNVELHQNIYFRYESLCAPEEEKSTESNETSPPLLMALESEIEKLDMQEKVIVKQQERQTAELQLEQKTDLQARQEEDQQLEQKTDLQARQEEDQQMEQDQLIEKESVLANAIIDQQQPCFNSDQNIEPLSDLINKTSID